MSHADEPEPPISDRRHAGRVLRNIMVAHVVIQSWLMVAPFLGILRGTPLLVGVFAIIIPLGLSYALRRGRRWALWVLVVLFVWRSGMELGAPFGFTILFSESVLHASELMHVFGFQLIHSVGESFFAFLFYLGAAIWMIRQRRSLCAFSESDENRPRTHCEACGEVYCGEVCPMCGEVDLTGSEFCRPERGLPPSRERRRGVCSLLRRRC
jgi:hypothetical protein